MALKLRESNPGAIYYVPNRGFSRKPIVRDDQNPEQLEAALDAILFASGSFNAKLLGAGASEGVGYQKTSP